MDLENFQGSSQEADPSIPLNEQINHENGLLGVSRVEGLDDSNYHETTPSGGGNQLQQHSVDSFSQEEINANIKEGDSNKAREGSSTWEQNPQS